MDIKPEIEKLLKKVIQDNSQLADSGSLDSLIVETPKLKQFGDYSSNIALVLAKTSNRPTPEVAQLVQQCLQKELPGSQIAAQIEKIEIQGPGFINFFLSKSYLREIILEIQKTGNSFGRLNIGKNKKVHIEFVSANPTGPLNVAHGRQAAFGDTLANILQFCGYKVVREYYLNDEGLQIDILGQSLRARYLGLLGIAGEFPADGYKGKYIDQLAELFLDKYGKKFARTGKEGLSVFSQFAYLQILKGIKDDLSAFEVSFDSWYSQKKLNQSGKITKVLNYLKQKEFLYQKDQAWWLATTRFGDDKDRVAIKSDGSLTYVAPDIAYHQTKFKRKFSMMINIWGPDHHGYIARLRAVVSALGYDPGILTVLIVQLVSLSSADKIIPMSTRAGQFVSLGDILEAVGKDAARFFFLMRKRDSHLNFDLELAKKQSLENPVYYVQYAYARILNILKFAQASGRIGNYIKKKQNLSLLDEPQELALMQTLREFPGILEACALSLEPHRLTAYLQDLAKQLHHFYEKHKVVTDNLELTGARLALVNAVKIVLKNGLNLLSVTAPTQM